MIKIEFLDYNTFKIKYTGNDPKNFNIYIYKLSKSNLIRQAKIIPGGYVFYISNLNKIQELFNEIIYINESIPSPYEVVCADFKLPPYPYQKEIISRAINNKTSLIVLPCGAGNYFIINIFLGNI